MARELTAYGFAATFLAVPATAASALLVSPVAGQISVSIKNFGGGSMEIMKAPAGATLSNGTADGLSLSAGYLMEAGEVVNVDGAPKFYLAATGATATAYLLIGLSSGY